MSLVMDDDQVSLNAPGRAPVKSSRLAFSVEEFSEATGLSRSFVYEAMKVDLASIKIGNRRLILAEDGLAWLRAHRERTP
jgi:hypothetical protein